ncbi:hypothetical protein T07_13846 [Trichinella nelsoni]|uniref:Uncharacterized protein n=1 Tax=Trichinella nelsoni TaxID=6336 RepID=A0A0V0RHA1_9BILA|nr:hypothetical protein T07_13846 [Trichinella nelsoni]
MDTIRTREFCAAAVTVMARVVDRRHLFQSCCESKKVVLLQWFDGWMDFPFFASKKTSLALAIVARRLNPNKKFWEDGFSDVQRYVIQYLERITSNFINIHDLSLLFICTRQDGDAHVQLFKFCSSIASMSKRYVSDTEAKEAVENDDHTLIVDYIDATIVTAETGIKACQQFRRASTKITKSRPLY